MRRAPSQTHSGQGTHPLGRTGTWRDGPSINTESGDSEGRLGREMNEPAVHPRWPMVTAADNSRPAVAEMADAEMADVSGSADIGGSALKLAIVGPSHPG